MKFNIFILIMLLNWISIADSSNNIFDQMSKTYPYEQLSNIEVLKYAAKINEVVVFDSLIQEFDINFSQLIIPDSTNLIKNTIEIDSIPTTTIEAFVWWFGFILKPGLGLKVIPVKDIASGDDWFIGYTETPKSYIQIVNGRSITILVVFKNNIEQLEIDNMISEYIHIERLVSGNCNHIHLLYENQNRVSGVLKDCEQSKRSYAWEIPIQNRHSFFLNDQYIIIDIQKINPPFRLFRGKPFHVVGGIIKNDSRIFNPISNPMIFESEMKIMYPDINDSLKVWENRSANAEMERMLKNLVK